MEKVCLIKAASETEHVHPQRHHSAASVCGLMSTSTLGFYSCGALPPSCQETHSNLKMRGRVGGNWGAPVKSQHTASLTWHLGLSADCTPGSDPRGDRHGGPAPSVDPVFHASPENPTYRGASGAAVHGATSSRTQPSTRKDYTMILGVWQRHKSARQKFEFRESIFVIRKVTTNPCFLAYSLSTDSQFVSLTSILHTNKKANVLQSCLGNSLAVRWLGLCAFTAGAWVWSLVEEPRAYKPRGAAIKKKKYRGLAW